jgi:hypothetical protein
MTIPQPEKSNTEPLDLPYPGKNAAANEQGDTKDHAYNEMKREDECSHQKKDDSSHSHQYDRRYP